MCVCIVCRYEGAVARGCETYVLFKLNGNDNCMSAATCVRDMMMEHANTVPIATMQPIGAIGVCEIGVDRVVRCIDTMQRMVKCTHSQRLLSLSHTPLTACDEEVTH